MKVRRVVGESMLPELKPGDILLIGNKTKLIKGSVVMAINNEREIVKRIAAIENNKYFLEGDNKKASTDSRHYGVFELTQIIGKVVIVFKPAEFKFRVVKSK